MLDVGISDDLSGRVLGLSGAGDIGFSLHLVMDISGIY